MTKTETEFSKLMRAIIYTPGEDGQWGTPTVFWSDVGWGKSARAKQETKRVAYDFLAFLLSHMDVTDVAMLIPDNGVLKYCLHEDMEAVMNAPNTVLFLDEFSECDNRLQAISMRILLERVVGNRPLPNTVVPIVAANPASIACGGHRMERPTANRLTHIDLDKLFPGEQQVTEWCNWMESQVTPSDKAEDEKVVTSPEKERERVLKEWEKIFPSENRKVQLFIKSHPALLQPRLEGAWRPKNITDLAFPTKRSNAKVARILAACKIHSLSGKLKRALLEGTVGEAYASAFIQWERNFKHLPDVTDFLDNISPYSHEKSCPDRAVILFTSAVSALQGMDDGLQRNVRITTLWSEMVRVIEEDPLSIDIFAPIAKRLIQSKFIREKEHRLAAAPILSKLNVILVEQ